MGDTDEPLETPEPAPADPTPDGLNLRWAVAGLVLPAVSYLIAYAILVGEAKHFGVPATVVSVSLNDVLYIALTIGATSFAFITGLKGMMKPQPEAHPAANEVLFPFLLLSAVSALSWWRGGFGVDFWFWAIITVAYVVFITLLLLRRLKKHSSKREVLDSFVKDRGDGPPLWSPRFWTLVLDGSIKLRPIAVMFLVFTVFFLSSLATSIGQGVAMRQTKFLTKVSNPEQVVVLTANGNAIVGTLGKDGHTLLDQFEVVALSDIGPLAEKRLGQLKASPAAEARRREH